MKSDQSPNRRSPPSPSLPDSGPGSLPAEAELGWQPRRANPLALSVSVAGHLLVLAGFAWLFATSGSGTTESPEVRSVGMAIVHRMPDRTKYVTEPSPQATPTESKSAETIASESAAAPKKTKGTNQSAEKAPASASPPWDLEAVAASLASDGRVADQANSDTSSGGTDSVDAEGLVNGKIRLSDGRSLDQLSDKELTPGRARAGLGAGRMTTQVFGVSGTGSTFVYVFDRSESMRAPAGAPLRASKSELIRSLETLTERQQFQIIFYNDEAEVFKAYGDRTGLVLGEEGTIARAKEFVRRTTAIGGTEHEAALRMALRLAPDVIFFLTDAQIQTMSNAQLDEINRRAESAGTTIHGIQFGSGPKPSSSFVERLATQNKGGYRYFDTTAMQ